MTRHAKVRFAVAGCGTHHRIAEAAPPGRIDDIEILRAAAILLVIVQHAAGAVQSTFLRRITHWGTFASGVDLFFVISGFVIARVLLPDLQDARTPGQAALVLRRFWIRRIWRIWPAAWLWLGLILLASTLCDASVFGSVRTNEWAAVAGIANFANVRFTYAFGRYFYGASFHYWSLSVEEQFYIVLPLLALCLRRFLSVFAVGFIILQVFYNDSIIDWEFRGGGLFFGTLLASFSVSSSYRAVEPRFLRQRPWAAMLATLALFVLLVRAGSPNAGVPSRYSVIALVAVVLVWLSSYARGYIFAPARTRPVLLWFGSRSFALYLVHVPVLLALAGATRAWQVGSALHTHSLNHKLAAAAFAAMLLLAELTHRLVERPFRDHGRRIAAGSRASGN